MSEPGYLAQLVEAMADVADTYDVIHSGRLAEAMLAAALACDLTQPCATCQGVGSSYEDHVGNCPDCEGSGRVSSGTRLMLGEQVDVGESVFVRADSLLSLAAHRGIDDDWKMEAIALSLRFRGMKEAPVYRDITKGEQ